MGKKIWQFASYHLWSQFEPSVGYEDFHCDMKRGFQRMRKKEPEVKALLEKDNTHQEIGILAQRAVYEFHQNPERLDQEDGIQQITQILELDQKEKEVHDRILMVLYNYQENPFLLKKNIVLFNKGDDKDDHKYPDPILINHNNYEFNFYAAMDCIYEENSILHIVDFKTGKSAFDKRQAYLYLLAAQYLYPDQVATAFFYNLETGQQSEPLTATSETLKAFQIELARIAKRHQEDRKKYRNNPDDFSKIFPPNPGTNCHYCSFTPICQFSTQKVH